MFGESLCGGSPELPHYWTADDDESSPHLFPEIATCATDDRGPPDRLSNIDARLGKPSGLALEHHNIGVWKTVEELRQCGGVFEPHDVPAGVIADAGLPVVHLINAH